jgi:hypothetical protein
MEIHINVQLETSWKKGSYAESKHVMKEQYNLPQSNIQIV